MASCTSLEIDPEVRKAYLSYAPLAGPNIAIRDGKEKGFEKAEDWVRSGSVAGLGSWSCSIHLPLYAPD
jgi:hypothetical protein